MNQPNIKNANNLQRNSLPTEVNQQKPKRPGLHMVMESFNPFTSIKASNRKQQS